MPMPMTSTSGIRNMRSLAATVALGALPALAEADDADAYGLAGYIDEVPRLHDNLVQPVACDRLRH